MDEQVDIEAIAALVREADEEQLQAGFEANRDLMLTEAFRHMPATLRPDKARAARAVAEWRITGREDGGHDRFQVIVEDGRCVVERDGTADADVTFTIGPVDFLRLITGGADPAKLFLFGRLRVKGDLMLAARLPTWFAVPGATRR